MRKSTKLKIFRRKKRSVILSVLKRHSLRQHTVMRYREFVADTGHKYIMQEQKDGRMIEDDAMWLPW